jgi:TP901 family phage tail tape measure protein
MALGFTVPTRFVLQDKMSGPLGAVQGRVNKFGADTAEALRSAAKEGTGLSRIIKGVAIGNLASRGIMALTRGIRSATQQFIDFDAAVVKSAALFKDLDSKAADFNDALKAIGVSARWVAGKTEFNAVDTAGALEKMAMAGMSSRTAISLLRGTTDLATAAGTSLTTAVDIATDALGAFGMAATQVNLKRVSDVMAATSSAFNTDLTMMFEAIKNAGPGFTAAGQSIDTLSASIGVLANAGIKGSEAGTALNAVFTQLKSESKKTALEKLIGPIVDAKGNFNDLFDIVGKLEKRLNGLGNAQRGEILSGIFGARGEKAVNLLLQTGSAQLKEYKTMLEESTGAAARMADVMRGSIKNQIEILKSSLTELGFKFINAFKKQGSEAVASLIKMVGRIDPTRVIKFFSGALSGAMTLLKILWDLAPAIAGVYTAFTVFNSVTAMISGVSLALGTMGAALNAAMGPIGLIAAALAAAGVAIGVIVAKSKAAALTPPESKYGGAARQMVAENEAARIEREREYRTQNTPPNHAAGRRTGAETRRPVERGAETRRPVERGGTFSFNPPAIGYERAFQAETQKIMDERRGVEIEKLRNGPRRYQIHSPYVNEFGPLSLDEALQVQAAKWSDNDQFNRATLRGKELADYISANPEAVTYQDALERLRRDAAGESVDNEDLPPELKEYLSKFEDLMEKINTGVEDLNEAPEMRPGILQYSQMGVEDFFNIARAGL